MSAAQFPDQLSEGGPFWGKYRGKVTDTKDEKKRGRILAAVPAIPGLKTNWALPCVPYAGPKVGFFALPPVGADVWIEFEGGNPNRPVWSGCFWQSDEVPIAYDLESDDPQKVKVFKTASTSLIIDDTQDTGEVKLEIDTPAVSQDAVTMVFNSNGVEINCGVSNVKMNGEQGITATVGENQITMTKQSITATVGQTSITLNMGSIAATSMQITATAQPSELQITPAAIYLNCA